MTTLHLPDAETAADLATFVARARSLDEDGAIRLQATGSTLATWVRVLPGAGLDAAGTVLGLRVSRLSEPADVDAVVPLGAVADRLARQQTRQHLDVPPVTATAPWAAVTPPRSGWERVGEVGAEDLREVARAGIAEVAEGAPEGAGAQAVTALRQRVWSRTTATVPPVPSGAAFGLHALGFSSAGAVVTVWSQGRWTRCSTRVGHVLVR